MLKIIIINGLLMGGQYALLSIGFSLVFGTAKILNLAHTSFYMIASFLLLYGTMFLKLSFGTSAVLLAIPITILMGCLCYMFFFARIKEHPVTIVIMATALALLFQESLLILFEGHYRGIPSFLPGYFELMNVRMTYQQLFAMVMCFITILAVWVLLSRTKLGNAIRSVSMDREAAIVLGMDVDKICLITMGISIALASIAAFAMAPIVAVHPFMWMQPLVVVLASVVLGGLGSIKGSIIAAFILALTEAAVVGLVPNGSFLKGAFSLGIMVVVLLFRPEGLFGVAFEDERL